MNISKQVKCVWWSPRRVASRATFQMLKLYGFVPVDVEGNLFSTSNTGFIHSIGIPRGAEAYTVLINVRNPYSRLVSLWYLYHWINKAQVGTLKTFEQFVNYVYPDRNFITLEEEEDFKSNEVNLTRYNEYEHIINMMSQYPEKSYQLIKYETLQDDIKKIPFINFTDPAILSIYNQYIANNQFDTQISKDNVDIGKLKRDATNPLVSDWRNYYTQELADIVYNKEIHAFIAFNYEQNSWSTS